MEISTAIVLLTVNLIILSLVIIAMIVVIIILVVKLNKIARSVQQTTAHVASVTEWFSPIKVFGGIAAAIQSLKKR